MHAPSSGQTYARLPSCLSLRGPSWCPSAVLVSSPCVLLVTSVFKTAPGHRVFVSARVWRRHVGERSFVQAELEFSVHEPPASTQSGVLKRKRAQGDRCMKICPDRHRDPRRLPEGVTV